MKKNKGFTLVEIIVILVILAILAAVLIPSLTTYIDKAREKQITANARGAYVATQALASECYGTNGKWGEGSYTTDEALKLAQLKDASGNAVKGVTAPTITCTVENGAITKFQYSETVNGTPKTVYHWSNGSWNTTAES